MSTKPQFTYAVGDRVAERPKTHGIFTSNAKTKERIAQHRSQRYGTVLEIKTKQNIKGIGIKLIVVQWDHLASPSEHAQMRICPVTHLQQLTNNAFIVGE